MSKLTGRIEDLEKQLCADPLVVIIRQFSRESLRGYQSGDTLFEIGSEETEEALQDRAVRSLPRSPCITLQEVRA